MTSEKKNLFYQRKKGEPITYDGSVEPIPLSFVDQEWPNELALRIKASPQNWNTLHFLAQTDPEYLGRLIFLHITRPVYEKLLAKNETPMPRGFHNEARQIFMEKARMYVAAAFTVISHWAESPLIVWPDYLQAVIREAIMTLGQDNILPPPREIEKTLGKESGWDPTRKKKSSEKSINIIAVVRYLIKIKYGTKMDELGLDNLEDMDDEIFRKIYFDKNKIEAAKAINVNFIQKHEDSLDIDTLYEYVPGFGWELIK